MKEQNRFGYRRVAISEIEAGINECSTLDSDAFFIFDPNKNKRSIKVFEGSKAQEEIESNLRKSDTPYYRVITRNTNKPRLLIYGLEINESEWIISELIEELKIDESYVSSEIKKEKTKYIFSFIASNNSVIKAIHFNDVTKLRLKLDKINLSYLMIINSGILTGSFIKHVSNLNYFIIKNTNFIIESNNKNIEIYSCYGDTEKLSEFFISGNIYDELAVNIEKIHFFKEITFDKISGGKNSKITLKNSDLSGFNTLGRDPAHFYYEKNSWPIDKRTRTRTYRNQGFSEGVNIIKSKIKNIDGINYQSTSARLEKEQYLRLRKLAIESKDSHLADEFYYAQMFWELKEKFNPITWCYVHLFKCGLSWFRPLITYLIIIGFSFLIYQSLLTGTQSAYLSFYASLPLLHSPKEHLEQLSESWQLLLTIGYYLQKAVQVFLLFEIGSAIRNQVKK